MPNRDHDLIETQHRVSTLWWTIFGLDGSNGLRGTQQLHGRRLDKLERFESDLRLLGTVTRWTALAVGTVVGILASGPAGQIVAAFLTGGGR